MNCFSLLYFRFMKPKQRLFLRPQLVLYCLMSLLKWMKLRYSLHLLCVITHIHFHIILISHHLCTILSCINQIKKCLDQYGILRSERLLRRNGTSVCMCAFLKNIITMYFFLKTAFFQKMSIEEYLFSCFYSLSDMRRMLHS